jgi:LAGLIDADG-like domain
MDRDNHAGKLSTIGWIAGFFDGEGYIGLWKRTDHRVNYKDTYRPSIVIANTDKKTIDYLSEQLISFGITNYIKYRPSKNAWRESWVVEINGFKRIKKFIDFIEEYTVTKKEQVLLVKEFLERRMAVYKNVPYIERDHEIYEKLKLLKCA